MDPGRKMCWTIREVHLRNEVVRRCEGRCVAHDELVVGHVILEGDVPEVGPSRWVVCRTDLERLIQGRR